MTRMSIDPRDALSSMALTPEQQGVLLHSSAQVCHVVLIDLGAKLDEARLQAALQKVVNRHEALRTTYGAVPGLLGLRQLVATSVEVTLTRHDVHGTQMPDQAPMARHADALARRWAEEGATGFQAALLHAGTSSWHLMLQVPGLASDAQGVRLLCADLARAYALDAEAAQEPFQYSQFQAWREELAQDDDAQQVAAYWTGYLATLSEPSGPRLAFRRDKLDQPDQDGQKHHPVQAACLLAPSTSVCLRDWASAYDVAPEVVIQAAWWTLLHRLHGSAFVAGWLHDCREDYEPMQDAVGVFEKVLPVVIAPKPEDSFEEWVPRLSRTLASHVDAQEHWPAGKPPLTGHLEVGVMFTQNYPSPLHSAGWAVRTWPRPDAGFELALHVRMPEQNDGLICLTVHGNGRYSQAAVDQLAARLGDWLDALLAATRSPLHDVPWPAAVTASWIHAGTGPSIEVGQQGVGERILAWSEQRPDAIALVVGEATVFYRELSWRVHGLASWMASNGVTQGGVVALDMQRGPDIVVAMLAAWHLGAAFLPLDPQWPANRIAAVLDDAKPALVLCDREVVHGFGSHACAIVALADIPASALQTPSPLASQARLSDAAYVLYTSGSTGVPKGVVVEHRQLLNYVAGVSAALGLGPHQRWGWTGTVAADLGHTALFGALFNGAALVIAEEHDMTDGAAFARFIREKAIDSLKIVPSHLEALIEHDSPALPELLVLGGESTPRALVERLQAIQPACRIFNHYGPTETTVGVMVHEVAPKGADEWGPVLPLTKPLANCRILVLDEALRPVAPGQLGEVYIGGAQVYRGYLGQSVSAAFIADPWRPSERLYRTGDLAWPLPEGGWRLAGRADHQMKVRGFRVEPAEIEAALVAQPGVRHAVVVQTAMDSGQTELAAFVVAEPEGELASTKGQLALRDALGRTLPSHMVPTVYRVLPSMPRLPSGKVDRRALMVLVKANPAEPSLPLGAGPGRHRGDGASPHEQGSALQNWLAGRMAELIGLSFVHAEDDFFDIGGHSLLVIKLVARIRNRLQVEVAPRTVFDHPTATGLAAALMALAPDPDALEARALEVAAETTA